jgi:4-hydroxy-4-methyl-2-oxoglutarate aldolase
MAEPLPTLSADTLAFYAGLPSSIVTDGLHRFGLGAWMDGVHPLDPAWRIAGRVRTLQYAPKSGVKHSGHSIYTVAESLEPGDVLLLATNGGRGWLLGENIAHFCMFEGLAGIVTDGRVRDVAELRELGFPIFAGGMTARPFHAEIEVVAVDVPVECAGGYMRPGDLIVGDPEVVEIQGLEKEQEILIRDRAPLADILEVSRLKKIRKGPPFEGVARRS